MPESVDRLIDRLRSLPTSEQRSLQLVAMLRQSEPQLRGLSAAEVERVRGHVFAMFERHGVPAAAIESLKEELRTSLSPVVLAGASRAVRALDQVDHEVRDLLRAASERIALRDEYVVLRAGGCGGCQAERLTARQEIERTLEVLDRLPKGHRGKGPSRQTRRFRLPAKSLSKVTVQDQCESTSTLHEFLWGQTSVIGFFYTRCMNPNKCSLTVSRLAALARHIEQTGSDPSMNVIAISYDSQFDSPARLLTYGRDRGFPFSESARILRVLSGWKWIATNFNLQVGYGASTVNDHAREIFLVRPDLLADSMNPDRLGDPETFLKDVTSLQSNPLHTNANPGATCGAAV